MYDSILIATDGSEYATRAADYAIDIAGAYGARLHVLSVIDVRALESAPQREHVEEIARSVLKTIEERAERAHLSVVTATRSGIPHEEILAYATSTDIDLIVVGARGKSGLDRFLLGSTTDRVMRLADVPVLIAPHPEAEPETEQ